MKPEVLIDSSCEHCGELEPFTLVFNDGCCTWCKNCAPETEEWEKANVFDMKELSKQEVSKKIEYFKSRIDQLMKG